MYDLNNSSTQGRRLEAIWPAAESTEGHGVNLRDPPPPPLQSLAMRQGESAKRGPSSSMGISREMSQTATDGRIRIKSPLDRVENSQPLSSPSLSKLPSTHTPPNSTAHPSVPTSRPEHSRSGSVRPDGAGDGGKARDDGQQDPPSGLTGSLPGPLPNGSPHAFPSTSPSSRANGLSSDPSGDRANGSSNHTSESSCCCILINLCDWIMSSQRVVMQKLCRM